MEVQQQIDRATSVSRIEALKTSEIKHTERVPLVVLTIHNSHVWEEISGTIFPPFISQKQ